MLLSLTKSKRGLYVIVDLDTPKQEPVGHFEERWKAIEFMRRREPFTVPK